MTWLTSLLLMAAAAETPDPSLAEPDADMPALPAPEIVLETTEPMPVAAPLSEPEPEPVLDATDLPPTRPPVSGWTWAIGGSLALFAIGGSVWLWRRSEDEKVE